MNLKPNTTPVNPAAPEEIIDAYKAAAEHAKGHLFASMLKVSYGDGWFTVRDLEGAESRYRKKEIMSATKSLLQQPTFTSISVTEVAAAAASSRGPEKVSAPPSRGGHDADVATPIVQPFRPQEANPQLKPAADASREQVITFPGPTPESKRVVEDKTYFCNLRRIFIIVAAAFGIVILFILLKAR